jgi:hypothetical protein
LIECLDKVPQRVVAEIPFGEIEKLFRHKFKLIEISIFAVGGIINNNHRHDLNCLNPSPDASLIPVPLQNLKWLR